MKRVPPRHLAAALLLCTGIASAADSIILTPSITLGTGMEGNRYDTADAQQAEPFLEASPGFSASWFATERADYEINASFTQRNFASDAGEQQSPTLSAGIHYRLWNLQIVATTAAGTFRDTQLPDNDAAWLQASLAAGLNFRGGQQLYLRTYYLARDYESRLTLAGEDQTADISGMILGVSLPLSTRTAFWTELQQTTVDSNEPLDKADEIAIAAGTVFRTSASSNLELSFKCANATSPDDEGIDTDTRPLAAALGYTQRFTDWCSWQSSVRWEQFAEGGDLYDEWSVSTGITLATDL